VKKQYEEDKQAGHTFLNYLGDGFINGVDILKAPPVP
jgi:hypothetical protein